MPTTDLLIIGGGIAGCAAALAAADAGLDVTVVTNSKAVKEGSNTAWAQGGIVYTGVGDSPDLLARDIHDAGAGICWEPAVRQLAELGPKLVKSILIDRCATPFDADEAGEPHRTEEAAHSVPRILHVGDYTGTAIARHLGQEVTATGGVRVLTNATSVDLILRGYHTESPTDIYGRPRCLGAYILDQTTGEVEPWVAGETLLATGGLGQVFLHTTNPRLSRGDGLAMAYRAGARVIQLEYVQFHPTAFYHQLAPRYLLTEALRGEGARLIDGDGHEFMPKYHELAALAPRDVVARGIHEEMLRRGEPCMYLDITHRDTAWLHDRFPKITAFLKDWGLDLGKDPIPVVPAAHYACGGVSVDLEGRTNVTGLRAAGEVTCTGVHGANRLASTSLLEGLVWGWRAGQSVAGCRAENPVPPIAEILPWRLEREEVDPALIQQDWMTIRQTMWNYVGLVRTTRRMNRALKILRGLQFDIETFYRRAELTDELIGLRNGAQAAIAITHQALRNRTSRGTHYRVDDDPRMEVRPQFTPQAVSGTNG
ncbi:MAG: L-aspartate oxidase [Sumerlaeia bacterium]